MNDRQQSIDPGAASPGFDLESAEMRESFLVESKEIMDQLESDLILLEQHGPEAEVLNRIFRSVHTLKGTSSFLGYASLTELAHGLENLLSRLRKGELVLDSAIADILFEGSALLGRMVQRIEAQGDDRIDASQLLGRLDWVGMAIGTTSSEGTPERSQTARSGEPANEAIAVNETTVRVDVRRLDDLMNLVGELVLGRNRLLQLSSQLLQEEDDSAATATEVAELGHQIDRVTTELQMAAMKARMIPVSKVFNKVPRMVRELARETGKTVALEVRGEETELDKSIVEQLADPIVHLVRNAVDHGIEFPAQRVDQQKSPSGTILLTARQEGSHIVITIEDDGRGLDPEQLKQHALGKELITQADAEHMSVADAYNLIFIPGFSTSTTLTNISGRGVGMDVVRTNVGKLKGTIDIHSEMGRGTVFTITLPLTLTIVQGLLVRVGEEKFALPMSSVLEVVRVHTEDIDTVGGGEVIRLRDTVLSLARLRRILNIEGSSDPSVANYIVVIGWAEHRLGLVVDELLEQKEIVVKPLGEFLENSPAIAGSTILGDGHPVLILDAGQLVQLAGSSYASAHRKETEEVK